MNNAAIIARREILSLPIERIKPNPNQPRRIFDQKSLNELAESISTYGVMQPISVRLTAGFGYELVAGERRLRASKLAGLTSIPAIIVNISDKDSALIAMIENMQRENLNFVEEALGFQNIMADFGFTQEELAARVGKSQSSVANKLRILRLPKDILERLVENDLTERHARALLKLNGEKAQADVLDKVIRNGLNVHMTEELIGGILSRTAKKELAGRGKLKRCIRDVRIFTNTIRQALDVMKESGMDGGFEMWERDYGYEIRIELRNEKNISVKKA
ncbi:MAG: ParB/RepB/Spo0J family partition protein [Defluviitaleaceae bacterium]|nr:ParB/RepB/Spo0J family partition protein [Defluviitaleaceae bacterium]